jgi:RyR domain
MRALSDRGSADGIGRPGLLEKAASRFRRRDGGAVFRLLRVLDVCYVAAIAYVCARALDPALGTGTAPWLAWFGRPGNWATIAVVLALPALHLVLRRLAGAKAGTSAPLLVIAAMATSALVLGMSAYWRCHEGQTSFFAPLAWTLGMFAGNVEPTYEADGRGVCTGLPMPAALEIARLLAIATTLTTALAAALTLFRAQVDRFAIWRAHSLTVVVGVDDETVSMVRALMGTLGDGETLVALAETGHSSAARAIQEMGGRVREINLNEAAGLSKLRLWARLDRLYLLSADPVQNLQMFRVIDAEIATAQAERIRLPLIVRIDDPWQAEVWRRSFLARIERRWVADAVGRYEVTAAKLVRHITSRRKGMDDLDPPTTVMLCGLHPLTYAITSELAQSLRDQKVYARPDVTLPKRVIIQAREADSFVRDHQMRQDRMAADGELLPVTARDEEPTVDAITEYFRLHDPATHVVVLSDPTMETEGTRLASRFPNLRVYLASAVATTFPDFAIVGRLYGFPMNMELEKGAPQDVWERAAELIHEHYSFGKDRTKPTARPWNELDPFIKHSNRRQVLNALWMVETIADHTWNSLESGSAEQLPDDFDQLPPLRQLRVLGFDEPTVDRMIEREHNDWCRYYRNAGWKYSETRDDDRKRHNLLLPWGELITRYPERAGNARESLVSTLINLRSLGYRSVPRAEQSLPDGIRQDAT